MIEIPRSDRYQHNLERGNRPGNGDALPCVICGKGVAQPRYSVHVYYGNLAVTDEEAAEFARRDGDDGGDLYYYPIGADCLRRHPEMRPYVKT